MTHIQLIRDRGHMISISGQIFTTFWTTEETWFQELKVWFVCLLIFFTLCDYLFYWKWSKKVSKNVLCWSYDDPEVRFYEFIKLGEELKRPLLPGCYNASCLYSGSPYRQQQVILLWSRGRPCRLLFELNRIFTPFRCDINSIICFCLFITIAARLCYKSFPPVYVLVIFILYSIFSCFSAFCVD